MTSPTLAEQLADWAINLDARDLPAPVTAAAVESVIDTLGCALGGSVTPVARAVRRTIARRTGEEQATVIGLPQRRLAPEAAFANATAAHALELDDTDSAGYCHAGAVVVPAVLAAAEAHGSSGRELLAAVVVGYEVTLRLARWLNPTHRLQGFHTTATVPTLGAAAAVARLARLDPDLTASAMGIAGSFASGTFEFLAQGANLKRVHAGKAAHGALLSVELAQAGVEGPVTVLEGEAGLRRTMAVSVEEPLVLDDLGSRFLITEVGRKPYPCCRFCHASIDAAIDLSHQIPVGIGERDETRVVVTVSRLCAEQTGLTAPTNELERQFSTPYGVALGLLRGAATLADYRDRPHEAALALARRVEVRIDPDLPVGDRTATVAVRDAQGRTHRAITKVPLGEPANPMGSDVLAQKFRDLASTVLPGGHVAEVEGLLARLPELPDILALTRILADVRED